MAQESKRISIKPSSVLEDLVPRSKWNGGKTGNETGSDLQVVEQKKSDIKYLTIHNFGSPINKELTRMKSNAEMHVKKQYGDVAYHYIVGASGAIYQGRRPTLAPASYSYYLNEEQLRTMVAEVKKGKIYLKEDFRLWTKTKIPGNTRGHLTVSFMCGGRVKNGELVEYPEVLKKAVMERAAILIAELLNQYIIKNSFPVITRNE